MKDVSPLSNIFNQIYKSCVEALGIVICAQHTHSRILPVFSVTKSHFVVFLVCEERFGWKKHARC